jgi:hypothetical protein
MSRLSVLSSVFLIASSVDAGAKFVKHRGYIAQGADVLNGTMTIQKAQELCAGLAECTGFTFAAQWDAVWAAGDSNFAAQIWLKGTDEWVAHSEHVTYTKLLPKCAEAKFMRYKKAGHGPYCCEGGGCPKPHAYQGVARKCQLPAAAVFGLPRCSTLQPSPLRNVAPDAVATASSEYPHAENSGPSVANDGVVNASLFHSQCDGSPQWWRLTWAQPVALAQIVLHNRKEFRARIFAATVRAYAPNGTVVAAATLRASRSMYIWTLRPAVRNVGILEVRTPQRDGAEACLHFKELEAFGAPELKGRSHWTLQPPEAEVLQGYGEELDPEPAGGEGAGGEGGGGEGGGGAGLADLLGGSGANVRMRIRHSRANAGGHGDGDERRPTEASRNDDDDDDDEADEEKGDGDGDGVGDGDEGAGEEAPPPRSSKQRQMGRGKRSTARSARPRPSAGHGGVGGVEEELGWLATTGSLTTAVLLLVQFLWVKARWLDCWR